MCLFTSIQLYAAQFNELRVKKLFRKRSVIYSRTKNHFSGFTVIVNFECCVREWFSRIESNIESNWIDLFLRSSLVSTVIGNTNYGELSFSILDSRSTLTSELFIGCMCSSNGLRSRRPPTGAVTGLNVPHCTTKFSSRNWSWIGRGMIFNRAVFDFAILEIEHYFGWETRISNAVGSSRPRIYKQLSAAKTSLTITDHCWFSIFEIPA